jgi:hypothetical protein
MTDEQENIDKAPHAAMENHKESNSLNLLSELQFSVSFASPKALHELPNRPKCCQKSSNRYYSPYCCNGSGDEVTNIRLLIKLDIIHHVKELRS